MPTADILFCILPVPLLISVGARICDWQFAGRNSQPVPMLWVRVQHEQLRTLGGRWPPVWEVTLEVRSLVSGWPPPDAIYVYLPGRRVYACVPLIAATAAGQAQSWTAEVFFEAECGWGAGLPALGWSL